MKKVILTVLSVVLFSGVTFGASAKADKKIESCDLTENFARFFMEQRQKGKSLKFMLSLDSPKEYEDLRKMVLEAYSIPAYNSDRVKQKTINDFANKKYLACLTR